MSNSNPSSSPDVSSQTSATQEEPKVKPRHLESRIMYTDYDTQWQKKITKWARVAVQMVFEKVVETENEFYQEVAASFKESLKSSSGDEKPKKWHVIVGNDFSVQADALKGTISFFAIGDVKFLIYTSPN